MISSISRVGIQGLTVCMLALSGCAGYSAMADSTPARFADGILVDGDGMTLYTFDKDPAGGGKSLCNDKCAENWPPLKTQAGVEAYPPYSVVTRDDGSSQWAYQGKPLYLWSRDDKPGDMKGDGFKQVWHVIREMNADSPKPARSEYGRY